VNKKLILVILIPTVISFIPLFYITRDYMSYLYWINHESPWKCNGRALCSPPANIGPVCKNDYENHNYASFHTICTIHGFDVDNGMIQFASIGISIIPTVVAIGLLSAIYLKQKTTIKK
jgi:hypothetical protein